MSFALRLVAPLTALLVARGVTGAWGQRAATADEVLTLHLDKRSLAVTTLALGARTID
jgi:hypothetical protein